MGEILNQRQFGRVVAAGVAVLCAACLAEACSVPVFRYALDHWTPDLYRIRVLHDGPLPAEQAAVVQQLQNQAKARFANTVIEVVDLAASDEPGLKELYQKSESKDQPLCLIQAPTAVPDEYCDVWSGPLAAETVETILASPVREKLVKSLLDGTSVVWIYLESGIKPGDDKHFALLQTELERLQGQIKLPEIDPIDIKELSTSPDDVKLKFETLRLSRDDPQEALLVEMLLSTEPDLRDATFVQQPMAFAVFGRGRVLYSLVGDGLTPELIAEACRFLTGACQCTVKAQNPGAELLLSVDWDGLIAPSLPTDVDVTLTGLAGFQSDRPAADAAPVVAAAAEPAAAPQAPPVELAVAPAETGTDVVVETALSTAEAEQTGKTDSELPSIKRRPADEKSAITRPVLIVSLLAVIVVVASFFLLPRR